LNLGVVTVKRVMADYNRDPKSVEQEAMRRGRQKRAISDSVEAIARQYIREANQDGLHITLETLSSYLEEHKPEISFSVRTLGRALDRWGFVFGKGTRSQHLKEKDRVVAARQRYLREKRGNRNAGNAIRPEVYLDESYVNKNHSNDFTWYSEEDGPWVQKPTGKGERLIIINAITKDSWVPEAKLVFKSTKKTGDYHGQMNHELFGKWFKEKLLPNIPKDSLIIMDNASYHNTISPHSAPTAMSKKERIYSWIYKNGYPVREDCLKVELVEMLEKLAPEPEYALDEIAAEQGHKILRTPPYHPELQPIEICWAVVKNHVARNCNFTMENLLIQLEEGFCAVKAKTCSGIIKQIYEIEDTFWNEDIQSDESS